MRLATLLLAAYSAVASSVLVAFAYGLLRAAQRFLKEAPTSAVDVTPTRRVTEHRVMRMSDLSDEDREMFRSILGATDSPTPKKKDNN